MMEIAPGTPARIVAGEPFADQPEVRLDIADLRAGLLDLDGRLGPSCDREEPRALEIRKTVRRVLEDFSP